jgi:DNA polymerase I-like protein with 3'-5' exonuclease and polymerase domains
MESPEVKKWDGHEDFNFNSSGQLAHLLYDILGYEASHKTKSDNDSVDEEALKALCSSFAKDILEYRKWAKAHSTYITQYEREVIEGLLHSFFSLANVITFRSSSNSPNFQNIPKHDEAIKKLVRMMLRPRKGNRLVEWDYKGVEVAVSTCYNKDPNLIKYVTDKRNDMHRDCAAQLFLREKSEVSKKERSLTKNGFTFPEFYGDYWGQIAPALWDRLPAETLAHLEEKGCDGYKDFESHVKTVEEHFWDVRFPVYKQWKIDTMKEYEKKGYIDLYTGFRCYGPMSKNEVTNYRSQGSAFHCLMWTYNNVSREVKGNDRSFLIGQIHDASLGDIHPADEQEFDHLTWLYGTQKIREHWDWIIVPLEIEKESSEVDGDWSAMTERGYIHE